MAARFKKRPPGSVNNKKINLNMLTLYDLMCPICQSIYIEPVTLPCCHIFCLSCFNGSIENNALACPLCRTRIGSWLRTTTRQNKLVNTKLWEYIKKYYENEVNDKLNGGDVTIIEEENPRILSAPGEIRSEYENEVERLRQEQKALEEKQSKESEKLIIELQEQERKLSEEREAKLKRDEELARQLAEDSKALSTIVIDDSDSSDCGKPSHHNQQNGKPAFTSSNSKTTHASSNGKPTHSFSNRKTSYASSNGKPTHVSSGGKPIHTSSNGKMTQVSSNGGNAASDNNKSKQFYDYLASENSRPASNGATKSNTLDRYVIKKNGSANGLCKTQSAEYIVGSPPSPELMSTAGRCGRFLKNFLTARLWGSSVTGCPNSTKTEPKVWEPQDPCAGHSRELSVNTGVVQHHHSKPSSSSAASSSQQQNQGQSSSSCHQLNDSISEEVVHLDTISEDSLAQELCYFKPLHPEPVNRFPGKHRVCVPLRPPQKDLDDQEVDVSYPDMSSKLLDGLERLKGAEFWRQTSAITSSFVCLVQVPVQIIKARESSSNSSDSTSPTVITKPNKKTIKRKHSPVKAADLLYNTNSNRSPSKSTTPKKTAKNVHGSNSAEKKNNGRRDKIINDRKNTSPKKQHVANNKPISKSCVKLGSNNSNPSDHVLTRSKRSISFGDVHTVDGLVTNNNNNSSNTKSSVTTKMNGIVANNIVHCTRSLRSNGLMARGSDNCDIVKFISNGSSKKTSLNGEHVNNNIYKNGNYEDDGKNNINNKSFKDSRGVTTTTNGGYVFDPSLIAEQKRIEDMIAQEKKDFALAKKLQRQFCGSDYISTGYTVRTAAKKQATLRDILPVAKKMKV